MSTQEWIGILNMMDEGDPLLPPPIDLDSLLTIRYYHKYKKARGEWTRSEIENITTRHLDNLTVPLVLLLKILSGSIIEVAAMVTTRVLHRTADIRKIIESNTDDKKMLDSVKAFITSSNVKCGRTRKELT